MTVTRQDFAKCISACPSLPSSLVTALLAATCLPPQPWLWLKSRDNDAPNSLSARGMSTTRHKVFKHQVMGTGHSSLLLALASHLAYSPKEDPLMYSGRVVPLHVIQLIPSSSWHGEGLPLLEHLLGKGGGANKTRVEA